jgi:hypothetical protein
MIVVYKVVAYRMDGQVQFLAEALGSIHSTTLFGIAVDTGDCESMHILVLNDYRIYDSIWLQR